MSWSAILVLAAGAYGLKWLGLRLGGREHLVIGLLPPALFASIIVVQSINRVDGAGTTVTRLAGVAVAVAATRLRAPLLAVIVLAVATTAGLRAVI